MEFSATEQFQTSSPTKVNQDVLKGATRNCRDSVKVWLSERITCVRSLDQVVVFICYILTNIFYVSYVHGMKVAQSYSPPMLVIATLLIKLVVSFVATLTFEYSPLALGRAMISTRRHLMLYIFPAAAYATTDALSIYSLQFLDPATFGILYHMRIVFTLVLYERLMHLRLGRNHWVAMGCILLGCFIKEIPTLAAYSVESSRGASWPRVWGALVVLFTGQIVAFGAVYNEKLLKKPLSLNVQNIGMYSFGLLASGIFLCLPRYTGPATNYDLREPDLLVMTNVTATFQPTKSSTVMPSSSLHALTLREDWNVVWSFPVVGAAMLSAAYGLVTAYFVRTLNCIVREIASVLQVVGTTVVNCAFFGYPLRVTDVLAIGIMLFSVWVYNLEPIARTPAETERPASGASRC